MIEGLPFTLYDLIALGFILILGIFAALWGLAGILSSVGAWLGAGALALAFYPQFQLIAVKFMGAGLLSDVGAAAGGFAISLAVLMLLGTFISKRVQASVLGPANRALGLATGLAMGFAVVSLIMVTMLMLLEEDGLPQDLKSSRSYHLFINSGLILMSLVPDDIKTDTLIGVEQQRENANNAYDAYQLYQHYIAPSPHNLQDSDQNQQQKGANSQNSRYDPAEQLILDRIIDRAQQ
ncbi:MAG: CvpA family protein [Alphaproteobacteria bacterium]